MKEPKSKVVNFQEYKDNKSKLEPDRNELLKLIKKIVTTK